MRLPKKCSAILKAVCAPESLVNYWIFIAGVVGIFTSLVHVIAGQVDPVRPFLKSDLPEVPKATLLACWHMVSVVLIICGGVLSYVGWFGLHTSYQLVIGISLVYLAFAIVFILVGWYFFGYRSFLKLPQWILLMPIGTLGLIGAV